MTYLLTIALTIMAIFVWLKVLGGKPKIHKNIQQDALVKYLKALLYRGFNGGYMIIEVSRDKKFKRFIQFSKYLGSNKEQVGIHFDFPLSEWSQPYYDHLKSALKKNDIQFATEKTDQEKVPELLVVDLKKDINLATRLSRIVFQEVYQLGAEDRLQLHFFNICNGDVRLGF